MKATVNGESRDVPDGTTVAELLTTIGVPCDGIAVARNERIVRRGEYDADRILEGDRIEIIRAVAGG